MECDDNSNETTACTVAPATESAPQPLTEQVAARKFDSPPTAMNAADIASAAMQVAPSNNGAVAAATFKKENLVLESEANGYKYYKIADTMFSEDAAGNWFKLNTSRNEFEAYIWPDEIKKRQAQKKEYPYVDVDKFGRATFPVNEHGEPILPKNEAGAKVFPIDNDGKPIFPWDWANDRPTLPVNDKRRPVFPIGSHGKPIVPMDIHGYPIFPLNPDDGNYLFPEREDGRPIPPVNIFDVPVLPLDEHGNHVVPYDSKGEPLIKLGGQDGLTPMTLEEYGEWEEQCRQWMLYQQQYNPEYYQQMYGDNQHQYYSVF